MVVYSDDKSSKWNNFILMLDFPAVGKGLLIGLIIGIFTASFIGLFFGSLITGYYIVSKRWKHVAINGLILGFISDLIWLIISFLFSSSTVISAFVDLGNTFGSTSLAIVFAIIVSLFGFVLMGLIGAIGAIIGSKLTRGKGNKL